MIICTLAVFASLVVIAAVSVYWNRRAKRENRLRQAAEQRLLDMTEKLRTGVFQLKDSRDGLVKIVFANRRARELGRLPEGSLEDADPFLAFNYIHEDDREAVELRFRDCLTTGDDLHETFHVYLPDGPDGWILADARRDSDVDGGYIWSGYLFDLTNERTLNEKLNSVLVARDDFVAAAGHELRAPIQNVSLALQSINEDLLNEDDANRLMAARVASLDLEELVDDFMEISNMANGVVSVRNEPFDLHDLISSICRSFTGTSQARNLGYSHVVEADVPQYVRSDSLRLKQILYNLLNNAFKYTNTGCVNLQVSCVSKLVDSEDQLFVEFSISDTGIGIPARHIPNIFEPFEMVESQSRKSSGLGLAICKRIVSLMNGRLSVESEEGVGSTFTASLPFQLADKVNLHSPDLPVDAIPAVEEVVSSTASGRILVVDDSEMVLDMLAALLELKDWQVLPASSGLDALALLEKHNFRAVITDHIMPGMNGLELGKILHDKYADNSVRPALIMMSGGLSIESAEEARELFDAVLLKPVQAADIHDAIMSLTESHVDLV